MYLRYKIVFWSLMAVVLFGLGYLVWTRLPWRSNAQPPPELSDVVVHPPSDVEPVNTDQADVETNDEPPPECPELDRLLQTAEEQLQKESHAAARTLAWKVMDEPSVLEFDANWLRAAEIVSQAHSVLANSTAPDPEKFMYRVKTGDSLARIAKEQGTTVGALQRTNQLDPTSSTIYENQVLYLYKGDWSITVSKKNFALLLMYRDRLFKLYHVGIGRQNRTPVGTFEVTNKEIHPAWTPPGKHFPYGHPENVLGTHWIGLTPTDGTDSKLIGYGIHGTWVPESIGTAASNGCIRMMNPQNDGRDFPDDVGELYNLLPDPVNGKTGVKVTIRDS